MLSLRSSGSGGRGASWSENRVCSLPAAAFLVQNLHPSLLFASDWTYRIQVTRVKITKHLDLNRVGVARPPSARCLGWSSSSWQVVQKKENKTTMHRKPFAVPCLPPCTVRIVTAAPPHCVLLFSLRYFVCLCLSSISIFHASSSSPLPFVCPLHFC